MNMTMVAYIIYALILFNRVQPNDENKIIFETGKVYHKMQLVPLFGDWIASIIDFGLHLHGSGIDLSSMACMTALTMVTREYSIYSFLKNT